jgi:two-component system, LytTR family, response regulator LytT
MKILIVDDEEPARGELRYIIQNLVPKAEFFEAVHGEEALQKFAQKPTEVVFLDIHIPGLDGLAVASILIESPDPPLIVFATAYDEYALRAFELAALDYVVKPFKEIRLAQTINRIRQALSGERLREESQSLMRNYLMSSPGHTRLNKIWGQRPNENWVLLDASNVLWVTAEDKHVYIQTLDGERLLVRSTLKELEPRLIEHNFTRVHKAYLVNLLHVDELIPWFSGNYLISMKDSGRTRIPLSRRYLVKFKQLTGWNDITGVK